MDDENEIPVNAGEEEDFNLDDILGPAAPADGPGDDGMDASMAPSPLSTPPSPTPERASAFPAEAPQPTTRRAGTMPPEAQELTYLLARQMQSRESARLLEDGWTPGDAHDEERKVSPSVLPFGRLSESQRKEWLDGASNAVMALLDGGYDVGRSETPDIALADDMRAEAVGLLVSAGRSRDAADAAVDAIEAAGFTIRRGPSKAMRRMESYFEMTMGGRMEDLTDIPTYVMATVNMARGEGIAMDEVNAFIDAANRRYNLAPAGLAVKPLTRASEEERIFRDMCRIYDRSFDDERRARVFAGAAVTADGRLSEDGAAAVARKAVERSREKVLPMLLSLNDGMSGDLAGRLEDYERLSVERFQCRELGYGGRWKEELDAAAACGRRLRELQEDYDDRMLRWNNYRWYEKVFIPRPDPPRSEVVDGLRKEMLTHAAEYAERFNADRGASLVYRLADGTLAKVSMQVQDDSGLPVLTVSRRRGMEYTTERRLYLADGSFTATSKTRETASPADAGRIPVTDISDRDFAVKVGDLQAEVEMALFATRDRQAPAPARATQASLTETLEAARTHGVPAPGRGKDAEESRRARPERERDEEMPALHPHLAGDITPRDVEILQAFRLHGGRGEDFKKMIEDLKDKRVVMYTGPVTYRRTHPWDEGVNVETRRVSIMLRLGADGWLRVCNPNNGAELGYPEKVLGSNQRLDYDIIRNERRKKKKKAQEEDRKRSHRNKQ